MVPQSYLRIAREAIKSRFEGSAIDKNRLIVEDSDLAMKRATFVTLTKHSHLRGCIGSLIAHRPLVEDLISNAQSAAFHDPRFPPLSESELDEVKVEVSLLSEPVGITYSDAHDLKERIRPGVDGVILRLGNHQATFLPQVWEELNDFETFFAHLGMKAGIGSDPLAYHPEIYTYRVDKIKEQ